MAVQAASLEILEKAAVPPAQARAIVQAIEIEIAGDRKSTRLNSSHSQISYAVFCLKKKKNKRLIHSSILNEHTRTVARAFSLTRLPYNPHLDAHALCSQT